jgi:hypothetical protein
MPLERFKTKTSILVTASNVTFYATGFNARCWCLPTPGLVAGRARVQDTCGFIAYVEMLRRGGLRSSHVITQLFLLILLLLCYNSDQSIFTTHVSYKKVKVRILHLCCGRTFTYPTATPAEFMERSSSSFIWVFIIFFAFFLFVTT